MAQAVINEDEVATIIRELREELAAVRRQLAEGGGSVVGVGAPTAQQLDWLKLQDEIEQEREAKREADRLLAEAHSKLAEAEQAAAARADQARQEAEALAEEQRLAMERQIAAREAEYSQMEAQRAAAAEAERAAFAQQMCDKAEQVRVAQEAQEARQRELAEGFEEEKRRLNAEAAQREEERKVGEGLPAGLVPRLLPFLQSLAACVSGQFLAVCDPSPTLQVEHTAAVPPLPRGLALTSRPALSSFS